MSYLECALCFPLRDTRRITSGADDSAASFPAVRLRHGIDTKPNRYEVICHVPQCAPPNYISVLFRREKLENGV
jgi:hypothetical protein